MSTETLPIQNNESISDTLERMNNRVTRRAYEIFEDNGRIFGSDLDNWLAAERELLWQPPIELSEKDGEFMLNMALAGISPKDLHIEVTSEELALTGEVSHEHQNDEGKVHTCEFQRGSIFRTIRFPQLIDPTKVTAEFKNGMLHIEAPLAQAQKTRGAEAA